MTEEKGVVKYQSRDGQEISLSFDTVKKYLVQGNSEAVTHQELMYFLGVCKSRGLNPFKKDAYLIKYGTDPAAIITSIDYFRSRARAQADCKGWKKGVIIQSEGGVRDSAGLVLDGEKVVGGFFEATPEGWAEPFRLEVNLNGYIKKTKDGKITRFWQQDNQPTMIAKVAESQGLRTLWPDEFQGIYEKDEIRQPDIKLEKGLDGKYVDELEPSNELPKDLYKANAEVEEKQTEGEVASEVESETESPDIQTGEGPVSSGPSTWNPMTEPIQQRYKKDKWKILYNLAVAKNIDVKGKTAREVHEYLLRVAQGDDIGEQKKAPPGGEMSNDEKVFALCIEMIDDEKEVDPGLVDMARVNARLKTVNPDNIEDAQKLQAEIIALKEQDKKF